MPARSIRFAMCVLAALPCAARAQSCPPEWLPGAHNLGYFGDVLSMAMWDPDGPGPQAGLLILAGTITQAGGVTVNRVANFNPQTGQYARMGVGISPGGNVVDVAVLADNSLVIAGNFSSGVKRWDGTEWVGLSAGGPTLGGGTGVVTGMAARGNDVCAVGYFSAWNGVPAAGMARWDGANWSAFGSAPADVFDIAIDGQGRELTAERNFARRFGDGPFTANVAGLTQTVNRIWSMGGSRIAVTGQFTTIASVSANRAAWYNGSTWSAMEFSSPNITFTGPVAVAPNGEVYAGGSGGVLGQHGILRFRNGQWEPFAGGLNGAVSAISVAPNGDLFVAGSFTQAANASSTLPANKLARLGYVGNCRCDPIDFNNDGSLFDPMDVDAFFSVFSEGPCIPANATCNDVDFNNDGSLFDPQDVDAFFSVFSEGPCL
jgi:hypothetical protein